MNVHPNHNSASSNPKTLLRSDILAHRRALSSTDLAAAAETVLAVLLDSLRLPPDSTVAAYSPVGTEPGGNLTEALSDAGHRVLLPVLRKDLDLEWAMFTGTRHTTAKGLSEPDGESLGLRAIAQADLLVVPALAVDADGWRLGKGGGCYDRALSRVAPATPVIALLHDGEWPRAVPREPHDRPVTAVVTPGGGFVSLSTPPTARGGGNGDDDA